MLSVIKWTLIQRKLSIFWWCVAVFAMIFINMIFYPSFKDQAEELQKSFENLPESTLQFIGGSSDFFSPVGFLNSQIFFLTLPLLISILAIGLGASLLAREEQDKTIESLLVRPISRTKLLSAKALAGCIILSIVTAISGLTTVATAKMVNLEVAAPTIMAATFVCWLLALSAGTVAYALGASGRARGIAIAGGTLFALGGYIISSLAGTVTWLSGPSKVFAFHYFQSETILRGVYNWNNLIYFVGVTAGLFIVAVWLFRRRDLV